MAQKRTTSEPQNRFPQRQPNGVSRHLVLVTSVAMVLTACATAPRGSVLDEVPESTRHARMMVTNHHRHEVRIVLVPSTTRYDLGTVDPVSSEAFRLPQLLNRIPARVHVLCAVERDLFATQEIVWDAGQVVEIQVRPMLPLSSIRIQG